MGSSVFALSIHADYKCRHSGVCCNSDWDVPVEAPVYRSLDEAVRRGSLRVSDEAGALSPFVVGPDLPDDTAAMLERTDNGRCVFFDGRSRLCIVHRDLGEPALPVTCRHFPRVAVRDRRGTFVTLSHYCPTAASMLFREDVALGIVDTPPAFPNGDLEGLVVGGDDLPPLLAPRMLMDLEGYSAWERHMVMRCADVDRPPESVLATLVRDAELLRRWKPGAVALADTVRQLPADYIATRTHEGLAHSLPLYREVMRAVPDDLRPEPDEADLEAAYQRGVRGDWPTFAAPLNRYLAAKAFASWTAYQGRGIRSIVRGLEAALALVRVEASRQCRDAARRLDADLLKEAFRAADFALNHLAIGEDLADAWSEVEAGGC